MTKDKTSKNLDLEQKWKKLMNIFNKKRTIIINDNYITRKILKTKSNKEYEFLTFRRKDIDGKEIRTAKIVLMKDEIFRYIKSGWDKKELLLQTEENIYQKERENEIIDLSVDVINEHDEEENFTSFLDTLAENEAQLPKDKAQVSHLIREKTCYNLIFKMLETI